MQLFSTRNVMPVTEERNISNFILINLNLT